MIQDVLREPAKAAIFLVADVRPGSEASVRDLLADLAGLTRAVGFRAPGDQLSCVVGIGASLWSRLYRAPAPRDLHPFRGLSGARHTAPATHGDLLFHLRARRLDLCFELERQLMRRLAGHVRVLDEVQGFKYFDERDLLGFVDGTENPAGAAARAALAIGDQDPAYAGGSYVIVQKYLHDLDAWQALPVAEQERVIGRSKLSDIELTDQAVNSHVAVNTIVDPDGTERQIVRENMAFGSPGAAEFGTYFIGYAGTPEVIERMLRRMFVGEPAGNHDRILDFSTAVTGSLFFVPAADFLENPLDNSTSDGSLGIGSLKRSSR
ncbi:putative iron-dependent peroxidase [Kribbella aluminosa]|uniref:Iron-dependent peroxidase n=1 Tax=Kribbella aluminosa TaxID=416017 RepID=A0ABS4UHE6_9ACTN|nr:Dyp-type peroxidase [Kribbella aluminosa]MBP2350981.1 putative iron-dependent peroxidase [Kribbella aluminosa]